MKYLLPAILFILAGMAFANEPLLQWNRLLPSRGEALSVIQIEDGGFVVAGKAYGPDRGKIFRTDHLGDTLWSRSFPSPSGGWAIIHKIIRVASTDFLAAGEWYNSGTKAFLWQFSLTGDSIWRQEYSFTSGTGFQDVELTADGGFIATGIYSYIHGIVVRTDQNGDTIWARIISPGEDFMPCGVIALPDSSFIIAGSTSIPDYPVFAKFTAAGEQVWRRFCGEIGRSASLCVSLDGPNLAISFGSAYSSDYNGQPQFVELGTGDALPPCITSSITVPAVCRIAAAVPSVYMDSYILGGWAGYSAYDHSGFLMKVNSGDPHIVDWALTLNADTSQSMPFSHINDLIVTADSGLVAVGRATRWNNSDWLLRKYCSEDADGGEFAVIRQGPPDWGFRLSCMNGSLDTVVFTNFSPGRATGDVSGMAASRWFVLPQGDGNDGDSIIFAATQPLDGGLSVDTFWLRNLEDRLSSISTVVGCPKSAVSTVNGGHVVILADGPTHAGFALVQDSAQVATLAFTSFPGGTYGTVTGNAAENWNVLPNGDGNDGDSIIFNASTFLISGSIDTFWLVRPSGSGIVHWSVGCYSDDARVFSGCVDSVQFGGAYLADGITLWLTAWEQENLLFYRVLGRSHSNQSWSVIATVPAVNGQGGYEYIIDGGVRPMGYSFLIAAEDSFGVTREYPGQILIVGENLGIDPAAPYTASYRFLSASPNPFNPSTSISFTVPRDGRVTLAVFDLLGREVRVLSDGMMTAGEHRVLFDGSTLPSGIYFARLQSGGYAATKKLLLLK